MMKKVAINSNIGTNPPTISNIGDLRFDNKANGFAIYDGTNWCNLEEIQESVDELCKMHPGLAELKKEVEHAQQKFDMYLLLVKENNR